MTIVLLSFSPFDYSELRFALLSTGQSNSLYRLHAVMVQDIQGSDARLAPPPFNGVIDLPSMIVKLWKNHNNYW